MRTFLSFIFWLTGGFVFGRLVLMNSGEFRANTLFPRRVESIQSRIQNPPIAIRTGVGEMRLEPEENKSADDPLPSVSLIEGKAHVALSGGIVKLRVDENITSTKHLENSQRDPFFVKKHSFLVMVQSSRNKFRTHVRSQSVNWFLEMNEFADVLYVVGDENLKQTSLHRLYLNEVDDNAHNVGVLTLAGVSDTAYPPLAKTTMAYEHIVTNFQYDFVLKTDDDTYIHGPRLSNLIKGRNPKETLYMGRPLHHCLCEKSFNKKGGFCGKDMGVHYCSGAAYVVSYATLRKMLPRWSQCRNLTDLRDRHGFECRSSDSTVGWCLNQAKIFPTPATYHTGGNQQLPEFGKTWAEPDSKKNKREVRTYFCQERNMWGGVNNRGVAGKPSLYPKGDVESCVLFHPIKRVEHFRYLRYSITRKIETFAAPSKSRREESDAKMPSCQLGIGVLTRAASAVARYAIRSTWGELANALGTVRVYFLLGYTEMAPHLQKSILAENNTHKDLVLLNMTDSYRNLFQKSFKWFGWASKNTDCKYIFKTDDDGYVRVLTLLDHLLNHKERAKVGGELYFGNQMWPSGDVIADPKNQWFMYDMYPHKKFPVYMSGSGYGLSSKLAMSVARQAEREPNFRVEDAGIGICVSKYSNQGKVHFLEMGSRVGDYGSMTCENSKDILDNPAFNQDFNMYTSFYHDLHGDFCQGKKKRSLASPSSHVNSKDSIYDFHPNSARHAPTTSKPVDAVPFAIPPWEWQYHKHFLKKDIVWGELVPEKINAGEIVGGNVYHGMDVKTSLNDLTAHVATTAFQSALSHLQKAHKMDPVNLSMEGMWKVINNWELSDFLILIKYIEYGKYNEQRHLVHIPYRGGVFSHPVSSMKVQNGNLTIVVPFACRLSALGRFLSILGPEFSRVSGEAKKIIVAWGLCNTNVESNNKVGAPEIEDIVKKSKLDKGISVVIKGTGVKFSRSSTLNLGLSLANKNDISVILDVDMVVDSNYFHRSRAFVWKGKYAYFPITFSFYNPALSGSNKNQAITFNSGKWRDFGFGMVSVATSDAVKKGYDAKNKVWGMEDVVMYDLLKDQGLYRYRMYDTTIKHLWHPKHCEHLKEKDKKRYFMCVGSKLSVEGTWRQLGNKLLEIEAASKKDTKTAGGG